MPSGKTLGRLATEIAHRLKGKHKADYSPHVDMGDHIVVVNAEKIRVTGSKLTDKIYYRHTGYIGSIKSIALREAAGRAPRAGDRVRRQGHAAEEPARPAHVQQAPRVRRRRASAHRPAAQAARDRKDSTSWQRPSRQLRHRPPQDRHRPRVPASPATARSPSTSARSTSSSAARPARMIVRQPLEAVQLDDKFDITVHGRRRRHHRPGRRDPPRHHPRADRVRRVAAQDAARCRFRDPRCARSRAQEGRPAQGPPRPAVLEALSARAAGADHAFCRRPTA